MELSDERGRAERAGEFGIAPAFFDIVHSVSQHDTESVGTRPQVRSDFISIVKAGLVVFTPTGSQEIVANLLAVSG